ncbi:hypothetical protein O181_107593 [Austropuccinia psidii MF-1]|uniref:Uncharacterized protein n=1 Tax=Austropuccinia psidii MF-1 TaxID=1389203 RepID=A0A9Q3JR64_9BASI|nr:hypothetical protein [Austropuccinia psidii MF-1]
MEIKKGWDLRRKFRLLEKRAARIKENNTPIQAIEGQWNQKEENWIPSGSQGVVSQLNSPVAFNNPEYNKSVAKSHNYYQSQVFSRRRQGSKAVTRVLSARGRKSQKHNPEAVVISERSAQEQ